VRAKRKEGRVSDAACRVSRVEGKVPYALWSAAGLSLDMNYQYPVTSQTCHWSLVTGN